MNHYIRTTLTRMAIAAVSFAAMPFVLCADSSPVTKTRLGSLYPDDLVVTDVSAGVDTNTVRDIIKEELITVTNGFIRTESDPTVGLTNNTVYASGTNVTFLTDHQDLSFTNDYRKVSDAIDWEDVTNHADFVDSTYVSEAIVSVIIDDLTSTNTSKALSANKGRELEEQIQSLQARGRYLSVWDASAGLPNTDPPVSPYVYKSGDYYVVGGVGATNYRPSGSVYTNGVRSTEVETNAVSVNDTYYFDNDAWTLVHLDQPSVTFSSLTGEPEDNAALSNRFSLIKYAIITNALRTSESALCIRDLYMSNNVNSARIDGLAELNDITYSIATNTRASIPARLEPFECQAFEARQPALRVAVGSGIGFYVLCTDSNYHDLRYVMRPGVHYPAGTYVPVMEYTISDLYGTVFTVDHLSRIFGSSVHWDADLIPSAENIDTDITQVCGARGYPLCYGRNATVREVLCDMLSRDISMWRDFSSIQSNSTAYVSAAGLRLALSAVDAHATATHAGLAQLDYDYRNGPLFGMPLTNAIATVRGDTAYFTVDDSAVYTVDLPAVSRIEAGFSVGSSYLPYRSGSCAAVLVSHTNSLLVVSGGMSDRIMGTSTFAVYPGVHALSVTRASRDNATGVYSYTVTLADLNHQVLPPDYTTNNTILAATISSAITPGNASFKSGVQQVAVPLVQTAVDGITRTIAGYRRFDDLTYATTSGNFGINEWVVSDPRFFGVMPWDPSNHQWSATSGLTIRGRYSDNKWLFSLHSSTNADSEAIANWTGFYYNSISNGTFSANTEMLALRSDISSGGVDANTVTGVVESAAVTNAGAVSAALAYTDNALLSKADLVNGKVPASQLPDIPSDGIDAATATNIAASAAVTNTGAVAAVALDLAGKASKESGDRYIVGVIGTNINIGVGTTRKYWGVEYAGLAQRANSANSASMTTQLYEGPAVGPKKVIKFKNAGTDTDLRISASNSTTYEEELVAFISDVYSSDDKKHISIGDNSTSTGYEYSTAVGDGAKATGKHSFAIGTGGVIASGEASVAVGNSVGALADFSTALGYCSWATANDATALGGNTYARGERSLAAGWAASVDSLNATALGNGAQVLTNAVGAAAIGSGAVVGNYATNAVQLGFGVNNDAGTLQFMGRKVLLDDLDYVRYEVVTNDYGEEWVYFCRQPGWSLLTPPTWNSGTSRWESYFYDPNGSYFLDYWYDPDAKGYDATLLTIDAHDAVAYRGTHVVTNRVHGRIATTNDLSHANPVFSNEVLAVQLSLFDTNTVAVLNDLAGTVDGIPLEGGAASIGALLVALAAAVASLKKDVGSANKDLESALNGGK